MQITAERITEIIDTVKEGVDNSWVGEIATYGGTPEKPTKVVNQVAMQLYLTVLTSLIGRLEEVEIVPTSPISPLDIDNLNN